MTGQEVGNYVLEKELGRGGMGEVYLGRHKSLGRKAAIKVMSPAFSNDPRLAERFTREARTQAQLRHPNIAQVLDHVEQDGRWYLIIEYMGGGTLEDVLARRTEPLAASQALAWARQALLGLDHAHQNGVVHRDVKPANILINDRGEAAMTDFGIAFEVGAQRLTSTGTSIGTPEYMSPEQIRGAADLDHRTDVYSMGVVLYELLAGRVPFEAASTFEVQRAQVSEPPPPLSQVNPAIPPVLEALVMRALAKDPAERYTSCGELAQAIDAYERGEPAAVPPPPLRRRTVLESAEAPMFPTPSARASTRSPTVMADTGSRTTPLPPPVKRRTPSFWIAAVVVAALAAGVFWVAQPGKKVDQDGDGTSVAVAAARRAQDELEKARQAAAAAEAAAQQAETAAGQAQSEAKKAETSKQPEAAQSAAASARLATATAQQAATTAAVEAGKADAAAVAAETAASEAANFEAADVKTGKQLRFSLVAVAYADEDSQAVEDARQYAADARAAAASAQRAADAARSSSERAAEASRRAELAARSVPSMPPPPVVQPPVQPPVAPPALTPPPDQPVVAVMAQGDPAMAALLEMEMEGRLVRAGFDVQDEHNSLRFNELLDRRGAATATEIMPVLAQEGYHVLVVLQVTVGATRELNVRGQSMTLSSAQLRMNAYLLPAKRSIGRGWTEKTEYTELSAPAKAEQAFLGATADLADAIESEWKSFLAQFGR